MQIFNISPICLLFQLQCFLLFIHLIKMDYCLVKYSLVTLNGLINPSTIRSITLSHYKLNATQETLPKLVIWDIYGPSMEKIWDELWSIYGISMALIWAIAFHIKPILGHCFFSGHILLSSPMGLLRIS